MIETIRAELRRPYVSLLSTLAVIITSFILLSCSNDDQLPGSTPRSQDKPLVTSSISYAPPCNQAMKNPHNEDCTRYHENLTSQGFQQERDGSYTKP